MPERKLNDGRIEKFTSQTRGQCICGKQITAVYGSDRTLRVDGIRYHYTGDLDNYCIFRCSRCNNVIDENFTPI